MTNQHLMIFGCEQGGATLVSQVEIPVGGEAGFAAIAAAMADPASPHRAVLLAVDGAGPAALEFADRHPERAIGVVVASSASAEAIAEVERIAAEVASTPAGTGARQAAPQPLTPMLLNDADVIRGLRQEGPAHRINAAGISTSWILTGHAATTAALSDPALIGNHEITAGFRPPSHDPSIVHRGEQDLVTIDADEHGRLRRLVGRYLTPGKVAGLQPRIQAQTDALLDTLPTDDVVDLLKAFARPLPIVVLCELFGIPPRDHGYIQEWLLDRMSATPPGAHEDVDDYLRSLIAARRHEPADDLIGWVVAAEGDELSEMDLISAARMLMVGGHRAPTTLLVNGVAALLREPEQWQRLVDDPELIPAAVEELLRFITPFPVGLARHVNAPLTVGHVTIPAGHLAAASLVAANRDPEVFTDPDTLDIARARCPHLAFGLGHHYCLGAALARAQAQIAIGTLVRRFPDMVIAEDARLHYRQSRVRYLLALPVKLGADRGRNG